VSALLSLRRLHDLRRDGESELEIGIGLKTGRVLAGVILDSSAIVKLVLVERESVALRTAFARARLPASELVLIEVPRALARLRADSSERRGSGTRSSGSSEALDLVPLTRPVRTSAGRLGPPRMRSLDAVHVTSAVTFGSGLEASVSYDRRQLGAAADAGLAVVSPGETR
jgi:predicted nucleic acid-binding protein